MPEISVVVPAYNVDKALCKRAIDSVLNQTFRDFEVLVVDDTATDESDFYKSFGDDRLQYIHNDGRLGMAQSRNKAMSMARGKYIAFMDADDWSYPERFQKQYAFMEQNQKVDILGACFKMGEKCIRHPANNGDIAFFMLMQKCALGMPTVFMRKSAVERLDIRFPQNSIIEDYDLWLSLISKAVFANYPEVLLDYTINPNSSSAAKGDAAINQASAKSRRRYQQMYFGFAFDWKERDEFSVSDWELYQQQVNELKNKNPLYRGKAELAYFDKVFRHIVRRTVREKDFRRALLKADLPICFKIEQFFKEQKK